ncbi:conserved hypothetical protein [uncultured Mycobacterium sp.]|uniref:Uncharacterized protein n=1 Tax=uncultured Mycobacterium sp. TaxID=171292 RepID=A0A1Y5P4P0_9MYCO|nr:conserved hypothetical protein [uncultured Mycobacterium sp.]
MSSEASDGDQLALHRFFCDLAVVVAKCKRCGKQVAVYWAHHPDCTECTVADDGGWRDWGRCECDPPPVLPDGSVIAADIAKGHAAKRVIWHRAPRKIYI